MADSDLPVFPFLPNWQQGITETLEWLTDVLRSDISAHEQRRAVRLTPRRFFEARFNPIDDARSFMDLWLQRFGAQEFLLPLWHDRAKLSTPADDGDTRLEFDNTFREFETGGLALLRNGIFRSTVVVIDDQDDEGLDLAAPLADGWAVGSSVYPLRPAALDNLQAVLAALTRRVGRASLSFRLTRDNPYPLGEETLSFYDGFPLVVIEPNRRDDLETRFEQMYAEADFQIGRVYRRSETNRAFAAQFYNWQARGRQQHHELRQTLYRLNGRQKAVWMPSFNKDVVLARDLASSSDRLDIQEIGYRFLGGPIAGRDRIALLDDTGTRRIVTVTGTSAPLATGEDRLNLSANAGFTASAGREGSFVDLVRMDQDRVEIEHYTDSDGVCEVAASFRSFAQGRTTAGTLVQPYPVAEMNDEPCGNASGIAFPGWFLKIRHTIYRAGGLKMTFFDNVTPYTVLLGGANVAIVGKVGGTWNAGNNTMTPDSRPTALSRAHDDVLWNPGETIPIAATQATFEFTYWDVPSDPLLSEQLRQTFDDPRRDLPIWYQVQYAAGSIGSETKAFIEYRFWDQEEYRKVPSEDYATSEETNTLPGGVDYEVDGSGEFPVYGLWPAVKGFTLRRLPPPLL